MIAFGIVLAESLVEPCGNLEGRNGLNGGALLFEAGYTTVSLTGFFGAMLTFERGV